MKPADLYIHTLYTFASYPWQKSSQILPSVETNQKGKEENTPPKQKKVNEYIWKPLCWWLGFCSSWIGVHVIPPAINILKHGPKTVCPGPHNSIFGCFDRERLSCQILHRKVDLGIFFFLRKDWIYHETFFTEKRVKWTTFLPKPQRLQIPLLEKLAASVEKINLCRIASGGMQG